MPGDRGKGRKKFGGFLYRHFKHIGDGFTLVVHLKGLTVVTFAVAGLARYVHIRQEVHLDLERAVA